MYTGKQLGEAIRLAIEKKMARWPELRKRDIAQHFGIKEPSIADWIKKGSIQKEKLPKLWAYFADVVGMSHWGLTAEDFSCFGLAPLNRVSEPSSDYVSPRGQRIKRLLSAIEPMNDAGIDHLISYALWVSSQYPKTGANHAG